MTPKKPRLPSKLDVVSLWLHDLGCRCSSATDHARRTQRGRAKTLIRLADQDDKATAIGSVIVRIHDTTIACPPMLDVQTFPDGCAEDRPRHLLWLAAHPQTQTLLRVLGLPVDVDPDLDRPREHVADVMQEEGRA